MLYFCIGINLSAHFGIFTYYYLFKCLEEALVDSEGLEECKVNRTINPKQKSRSIQLSTIT